MPPRVVPTKLSNWPWVVVRVECTYCSRRGCYRLARLAAKYGPEQSLAGLLADLAQDCPWWRTNPRKYEPRCAACFIDLERNFPPADHPNEPLYRQRQPDRESMPKSIDRLPAAYQGGVPTLSNWPDADLVLSCDECGRREVLHVAELKTRLGSDTLLTNARVLLTHDCPRRTARSVYEQCQALLKRAST